MLLIVLALPGFAWLGLFWDPDQDLFERLAGAVGISLSLTALVGLATFLIPLRITAIALVGFYLALLPLAAIAVWRWLREGRSGGSPASSEIDLIPHWNPLADRGTRLRVAILLIGFLVLLGLRFYQIRDLALPAWVDSVHHVLIVEMILENGGVPDTFTPYMPVPFYYHFGFHVVAAAYSALARIEPYLGVLQIGQVLNAAVALSAYRLGKALWSDWRRAALSALLVGFVTQMPAYYVTWGRYTLLTGMVLLPLAIAAALDLVRKGPSPARFSALCLLTSGLLLAHFYAAFLFAIFLFLLGCLVILKEYREGGGVGGTLYRLLHQGNWLPLLGGALFGLGLAGTWVFRAWYYSQRVVEVGALASSIAAVEEFYFPNYLSYLWRLLGPLRNQILTLAALPGLVILIRRAGTRAFGIWSALLAIFTLPWGVYMTPFRPDHAAIVLFLPVSMQLADLTFTFVEWRWEARLGRLKAIAVSIAVAGLVVLGFWQTRTIVNPGTVLATNADKQAIEWIEGSTPHDARFFINVNHWQYGIYRGSDGGWWILPLSGRQSLLPPALYPMGDAGYVEQINTLAAAASQAIGCSPEFWEVVESAGLTHIYLKEGQGSVRPEDLLACPRVEQVYSREGVFIYRIEN
jgi:hypothetical protein